MPKTTKQMMIDKLQNIGAVVTVFGANWNEADALAREEAIGEGTLYVPPFDHPLIWQGNSSLVPYLF